MKNILVTGGSSGIGQALSQALADRGWKVFCTVRTGQDGDHLRACGRIIPLLCDLTDPDSLRQAALELKGHLNQQRLDALVNNAGITIPGPLALMPLDQFRLQLEVNLTGQLAAIQAFLPLMTRSGRGPGPRARIINLSSVSGKVAYPFMGAYAASKHGLEAMSDALRRELHGFGVDLVLVEPGTVQTGIIHKFEQGLARYRNTPYGPAVNRVLEKARTREKSGIPLEKVVRVLIKALETPFPRARYAIPRTRLSGWYLPRFLPTRLFDLILVRELDLDSCGSNGDVHET